MENDRREDSYDRGRGRGEGGNGQRQLCEEEVMKHALGERARGAPKERGKEENEQACQWQIVFPPVTNPSERKAPNLPETLPTIDLLLMSIQVKKWLLPDRGKCPMLSTPWPSMGDGMKYEEGMKEERSMRHVKPPAVLPLQERPMWLGRRDSLQWLSNSGQCEVVRSSQNPNLMAWR